MLSIWKPQSKSLDPTRLLVFDDSLQPVHIPNRCTKSNQKSTDDVLQWVASCNRLEMLQSNRQPKWHNWWTRFPRYCPGWSLQYHHLQRLSDCIQNPKRPDHRDSDVDDHGEWKKRAERWTWWCCILVCKCVCLFYDLASAKTRNNEKCCMIDGGVTSDKERSLEERRIPVASTDLNAPLWHCGRAKNIF